jgi:hypothetical protein
MLPLYKYAPLWGICSILLLVVLLTGPQMVSAQDLLLSKGTRSAGMGQCAVALTGFWNINDNQAGMADVKDFSAGINYEERFGMRELSTKSVALLYPVRWGVLGAGMDYFGYSLYHEMKFGLAFARSFGSRFRAGIKLDYFQTGFGDHYGKANNLTFEFGFQYDLSKNLTLGGFAFNPIPTPGTGAVYFKLPVVYQAGLSYRFSRSLLVTVESEKNARNPNFELRAGLEYSLKNKYFFRTGLGTGREFLSAGFGYRLKGFSLDMAAAAHQALGVSPQVSLIYTLGS